MTSPHGVKHVEEKNFKFFTGLVALPTVGAERY
jgi:hypothetical protein